MKVVGTPDSKQGESESMAALAAGTLHDLPCHFPDRELVHQYLTGGREAARTLHARYYPAASAFLRKLGTRSEELEDACQEVFLQFFRYLATFRGDAELKTWLYRICVTEARRARRRRKVSAVLDALLRVERVEETVPASTQTDATVLRLVNTALDRMNQGNRLVFVLFEMEGLPGKEVAKIAGCPLPTVWRRLHDARRTFRETLGVDPSADDEVSA